MPPRIPGPGNGSLTTLKHEDRGVIYEGRFNTCGKSNCKRCNPATGPVTGHGPYYYLCKTIRGKWFRQYLGRTLDTSKYRLPDGELDWVTISAERRAKREKRAARKRQLHGDPTPPEPPGDSPPPGAAEGKADTSPPLDPPIGHHCYVCARDLSPGTDLHKTKAAANLCGDCHTSGARLDDAPPPLVSPQAE